MSPPLPSDLRAPPPRYALSRAQARLSRLEGDRGPLTAACAARIEGPLDAARLERALLEVARAHEILRTRYVRAAGAPLQEVQDEPESPPLGARLERTGPSTHRLTLRLPALSADRASLGLLVREVALAYEGDARAEPLPYADYCGWEEEQRAGEAHRALLARVAPHARTLPALVRPTEAPPGEAVLPLEVSGAIRAALALAAREGRLEGALLAALGVHAWRLAGRRPVVLGVVDAGRAEPETRDAIGAFERLLPVLCAPEADQDLAAVARAAAAGLAEARALAAGLPSAEPAPAIQLEVHDVASAVQGGGCDFHVVEVEAPCGALAWRLRCLLSGEGARLALVHDPSRVPDAEARLVGDQLADLVAEALERPATGVVGRPLASPLTARLLEEARAPIPLEPQEPVGAAFRRWVDGTPAAPAVRARGRDVSYAELGRLSRRIARAVRARAGEAGESAVVAVTGERSAGLVAALVGVLESGCALLPVDPALPPARRALMARLAGASLEVRVGGPAEGTGAVGAAPLLVSPEGDVSLEGEVDADGPPPPPLAGDGDAYVVFTSGTSGEPRGVVGGRAALAHFISWQRQEFGVGPGDRVPLVTGLSFDVVLRDLLLPLTSGATLVVPSDEERASPRALVRLLALERVTVLHAVPSLAGAWLAEAPDARLPDLRLTLFAGEPLPGSLVRRWRAVAPGRVVNLYGPSETTLARFRHEVPDPPEPGAQPVGRPIPGVRAIVLDPEGRPSAPGEPGLVVIRTPYRARRLLGPGRGFAPNPFADATAGDAFDLVYATGDRGLLRPDGTLTLAGRLDEQVKIQGVRVEPAEVLAELLRLEDVRAAAVVARDVSGRTELVAAVVTPRLDLAQLRAGLAARLPAAFVPARWIKVERLPLTPNGKVDRAAVQGLAEGRPALAIETPAQALVAALLGELLPREGAPRSRDVTLFELGGGSLTVVSLVARLRERAGVEVAPIEVFRDPSVVGIARAVEAAPPVATEAEPGPDDAAIRPDDARPLSGAEFRIWYESIRAPEGSDAYHLAWAVELAGDLRPGDVARALRRVAGRHEVLRSVFPLEEGRAVRRVTDAPLEVPLTDLSALGPSARDRAFRELAQATARAPFDLAAAPPLRAALVRRGPRDHALLLCAHHILLDAWGRRLFTDELLEALAAARAASDAAPASGPSGGAPRPRERSVDEAALRWWARRLEGARPTAPPVDAPWSAAEEGRAESVLALVPPDVWAALRGLAAARGATPFMTVVAALDIVLARAAGTRDVVVGSPVANRGAPGAAGVVGCLINVVALRVDLSGDPGFGAVLERVRGAVVDAVAREATPFERIVHELRPPRAPGRHPVFDVLVNMLDAPREPRAVPGLAVRLTEPTPPPARFAITLYAREEMRGLTLRLVHRAPLFTGERMRALVRDVAAVLAAAVQDPDRPVGLDAPAGARGAPLESEPAAPLLTERPLTPTEEALAALLREELGVDRVTGGDDLFALGAHSLLIVRIVARVRATFDVDLPLRAAYESPTLEALAGRIASLRRERSTAPRPPPRDRIVVTPAQRHLLERMSESEGGAAPLFTIPRAVRIEGPLDEARLRRALRDLAARHAALRARIDGLDLRWDGPAPALTAHDLSGAAPEERAAAVASLAREAWRAPFDPSRDPALRCHLARLGPDEHALVVVAHELFADCWSMGIPFAGSRARRRPGILLEELGALLAGLDPDASTAGETRWDMPEALLRQEERLRGEEARRERARWAQGLAGLPPQDLPFDRPRQARRDFAGARPRFTVPAPEAAALRALARRRGASLFEALLAALSAALAGWTGRRDICVGTPVPARARPELRGTIGPLGNHLALRTQVDPDASFHALLDRARATCREALAHQELPFALAVEGVAGPGAEAAARVLAARLILHRAGGALIRAGGLTLAPVPIARGLAKYDLTLFLVDAGVEKGPDAALEGWIEHATALLDAATVERLGGRLLQVVRAALEAPDEPLARAAERRAARAP